MNRIVYNIPRFAAKEGKIPYKGSFIYAMEQPEIAEQAVWISIADPDYPQSVISGPFDKLPKIKLAFWDLVRTVEHNGKILRPPPEKDARKIVNFLLKNREKRFVIVNCAAGVSRSGAISQFCSDFLDYEWEPFCKSNSAPNSVLYRLMVNYYQYLLENENILTNQLLEDE